MFSCKYFQDKKMKKSNLEESEFGLSGMIFLKI